MKQEADLHGVVVGERAQVVVTAGDHGGHRQFAAVAQVRHFVLEVSCHHVANLAHSVFHLSPGRGWVRPKHLRRHQGSGLAAASAESEARRATRQVQP
jgi:hypothetical protein